MAAFPELPVESVVTDGAVSQVLGLSVLFLPFSLSFQPPECRPRPVPLTHTTLILLFTPVAQPFFIFRSGRARAMGYRPHWSTRVALATVVEKPAHAKHASDGLASEIGNKFKQLLASGHAVRYASLAS